MSKNEILQRIRKSTPELMTLPNDFYINEKDSSEELKLVFKESLIKAGAEITVFNNEDEISMNLKSFYEEALDFDDPKVWAEYPDNCIKNKLEKIGTAVIRGQFGVAENGAIWFNESNFPNRLIPFVAQQLVVKMRKENLVKDMHEACQKINQVVSGYSVFIAGPSKTADIEQSLVYGAHGAKKLIVMLF